MGLFEQLPYTNFSNLNLGELVKFINETLKTIEKMSLDIVAQNKAIADFKQYVMDYLDNLNVEQDVRDYIDELIANHTIDALVNKSWLSGKNIVWYGDSWGTTADNPVSKFMSEFTDVNVTNRCIGGTLMTRTTEFPGFEYNSGYQLITSANDLNDFDYIFIMYGVNDWQTSRVLKTDNPDEYEYNYCVENVIDYLQSTYPTCIPVFIFQTYCYKAFGSSDLNGVNYAGCNLPSYINNAIDICERRNVKYINLFELSGITRRNYTTHLRNDSGVYVHLKNDMSERVSKLIYWGNFNSGKCYGDNWSNNLAESTIDMSANITRVESETLVHGITSTPMRKITTSDTHSMCINPSKDDVTVIHLTFYKSDTVVNGLYVDRQMIGEANARLGITNINKVGLVDCYIEVNRADLINVAIVTASGDSILYGYSATIKSDVKDIKSIFIAPSKHAHVTTDLSGVIPEVVNGTVNIPSYLFTVDADIAAFSTILTSLPRGYFGESNSIIAFDATTASATYFNLYNGELRNGRALTNGHTYIIPAVTFSTPH